MTKYRLILSIGLLFSLPIYGQVVLQDEPIPLTPTGFYISAVEDERNHKLSILGKDLQGGSAVSLYRYLQRNLPRQEAKRPVIIKIKELALTETNKKDGRLDGQVQLQLSFGLEKDYGFEHLVDYRGGLKYNKNQGDKTSVERYIRPLITASLTYFNDWVKDNEPVNRKLATAVRFNFTDYTEVPEGDTIYYSRKRPLTFKDFQSRNRPIAKYSAVVFPSIGYEHEAKIVKGVILVDIAMKAFLPKSAAWVNVGNKDDYTLNHEQRHFDIAKIIADQFKQKVQNAKLTPDTFEGFMTMQYLDSLRDLHTMQTAYDQETSHGMNRLVQERWNSKIDQLLE
ncbi:hypothetical protein IWX76_001554 [Pedobacter sp. CAN_A7]|uniref:hypothetical protein n=1 Tax=Pedobacter sp. CAN_A7 TaxID=2787722 RepID=UPI0018C905EA